MHFEMVKSKYSICRNKQWKEWRENEKKLWRIWDWGIEWDLFMEGWKLKGNRFSNGNSIFFYLDYSPDPAAEWVLSNFLMKKDPNLLIPAENLIQVYHSGTAWFSRKRKHNQMLIRERKNNKKKSMTCPIDLVHKIRIFGPHPIRNMFKKRWG